MMSIHDEVGALPNNLYLKTYIKKGLFAYFKILNSIWMKTQAGSWLEHKEKTATKDRPRVIAKVHQLFLF